jgi:hypothetical protein
MKGASRLVDSARGKFIGAALAAAAIGAFAPAAAGTPTQTGLWRTAAPMESPTQQAGEDSVVLVCRKAPADPSAAMGGPPAAQNLPLICLAAPGAELAVGPARFHELLEKAASSGAMVVFVLQQP